MRQTNSKGTRRTWRVLAAGTVLAIVATSCGDGEDVGSDPLAGSSWEMTSVQDGGEVVAASPTDIVTAVFADGHVSGSDGCNRYVMPYSVAGNTLSFGELTITGHSCRPSDVGAQGDAFISALQRSSRFSRSGDVLELLDSDAATQARFRPAQELPLTGVSWWLEAYAGPEEGLTSPLADTRISLAFGADGTVTGIAGCNSYNATYEADGGELALRAIISTEMACPEPEGVMGQEADYLTAIARTGGFSTSLTGLELHDESGNVVAEFRFGGRIR